MLHTKLGLSKQILTFLETTWEHFCEHKTNVRPPLAGPKSLGHLQSTYDNKNSSEDT